MKIAILLPHLEIGGIEKGLVRLVPAFLGAGHSVVVILQDRRGSLLAELPENVPVLDLGGHRLPRTTRALYAALRQEKPDVIYTATFATNVMSLAACKFLRNAPASVVSEHTPLLEFLNSKRFTFIRKKLIKYLYPKADALCAPIQDIIDEHKSLIGAACPDGHVLPNPAVTHINPSPTIRETCSRFVSVGRLSPEKGFDRMIAAFALFAQSHPDGTLEIYGDGPAASDLQEQIDSLDMSERIKLMGHTSDVNAALQDSDMFLCTSRREGLGNAILEAMAAGIPVLSVDCPFGPRELLQSGKAGALIADGSAQQICEGITNFASNFEARCQSVSAGKDVAKGFSLEVSAKAHLDFFETVVLAG